MNRYKTGRRPSVHTVHTMRRAIALAPFLDSLGTPPAKPTDYIAAVEAQYVSNGGWGMMGNGPARDNPPDVPDGAGDCVCAMEGHTLMLRTANAGSIVIPTATQILALYSAQTGFTPGNPSTDQGTDETSDAEYMISTGLLGHKAAATGMIDPKNIAHLKWGIQIFGSVNSGVVVNEQMEEQFDSLQPWTQPADPNDPNAGGHGIPFVYYDNDYVYAVTWGGGDWPRGLQPISWSLVQNSGFLGELHALPFPDFIRSGGTAPSGFDLQGLLEKLQQVELQQAA